MLNKTDLRIIALLLFLAAVLIPKGGFPLGLIAIYLVLITTTPTK